MQICYQILVSSILSYSFPLCLDCAALCQFLTGKHRLAKVELELAPIEVAVAALSTESSTMEELKWNGVIPVRAFIHCTMRTTFDVHDGKLDMYTLNCMLHHLCAFGTLPDSQMMQCLFISPCSLMMHQVIYLIVSGAHL